MKELERGAQADLPARRWYVHLISGVALRLKKTSRSPTARRWSGSLEEVTVRRSWLRRPRGRRHCMCGRNVEASRYRRFCRERALVGSCGARLESRDSRTRGGL